MLGFVEALGEEDVDDEDAAEQEAEEAAGGGHQQQDPLLQLHPAKQQIMKGVNKILRNTGIRNYKAVIFRRFQDREFSCKKCW